MCRGPAGPQRAFRRASSGCARLGTRADSGAGPAIEIAPLGQFVQSFSARSSGRETPSSGREMPSSPSSTASGSSSSHLPTPMQMSGSILMKTFTGRAPAFLSRSPLRRRSWATCACSSGRVSIVYSSGSRCASAISSRELRAASPRCSTSAAPRAAPRRGRTGSGRRRGRSPRAGPSGRRRALRARGCPRRPTKSSTTSNRPSTSSGCTRRLRPELERSLPLLLRRVGDPHGGVREQADVLDRELSEAARPDHEGPLPGAEKRERVLHGAVGSEAPAAERGRFAPGRDRRSGRGSAGTGRACTPRSRRPGTCPPRGRRGRSSPRRRGRSGTLRSPTACRRARCRGPPPRRPPRVRGRAATAPTRSSPPPHGGRSGRPLPLSHGRPRRPRSDRQGPLLETERRVEVVEHDGAHGAILRPRSTGAARASPSS